MIFGLAWWVSGPGGMTNPSDGIIRPAADAENIAIVEAVMDLPQMIDFIDWQVHFFDFAILGALQTDRFGNINTVCIGDHARPRLRGPGTVGISALCGLSRRFYIMMTRHDRGAFVPKVDFVCGAGFLDHKTLPGALNGAGRECRRTRRCGGGGFPAPVQEMNSKEAYFALASSLSLLS